MSRTAAVEGAECIQQLTGPAGEYHTTQLAKLLSTGDNGVSNENNASTAEKITISSPGCASSSHKETSVTKVVEEPVVIDGSNSDDKDDVQIVNPDDKDHSNEVIILNDSVDANQNQCPSKLIELLDDPVVTITPLNVEKPSLVVKDNIDVKKEEIESSSYVAFTTEEDKYIIDGFAEFGKRWTNILKCSKYTFHSTRNKDTLRGRYKTLVKKGLVK